MALPLPPRPPRSANLSGAALAVKNIRLVNIMLADVKLSGALQFVMLQDKLIDGLELHNVSLREEVEGDGEAEGKARGWCCGSVAAGAPSNSSPVRNRLYAAGDSSTQGVSPPLRGPGWHCSFIKS